MSQILKNQKIHNALIFNKFPTLHTTIGNFNFSADFSPFELPKSPEYLLDYFKDKVTVKDSTNIYRGKDFLASLPVPLFFTFLQEYHQFQYDQLTALLELTDYIKSPQSEHMWTIFKAAGPTYIFPSTTLNSIQKHWIHLNVNKDTNNQQVLIKDVMEALKPWLNVELYKKMRESAENTRENVYYDDAARDKELQEKAASMMQKKDTPINTDDIIEAIED